MACVGDPSCGRALYVYGCGLLCPDGFRDLLCRSVAHYIVLVLFCNRSACLCVPLILVFLPIAALCLCVGHSLLSYPYGPTVEFPTDAALALHLICV